MQIPGRVKNGVVVLEGNHSLPEGARVVVILRSADADDAQLPFPIVRSKRLGSLDLTNDKIAELLEDEDVSSGR